MLKVEEVEISTWRALCLLRHLCGALKVLVLTAEEEDTEGGRSMERKEKQELLAVSPVSVSGLESLLPPAPPVSRVTSLAQLGSLAPVSGSSSSRSTSIRTSPTRLPSTCARQIFSTFCQIFLVLLIPGAEWTLAGTFVCPSP